MVFWLYVYNLQKKFPADYWRGKLFMGSEIYWLEDFFKTAIKNQSYHKRGARYICIEDEQRDFFRKIFKHNRFLLCYFQSETALKNFIETVDNEQTCNQWRAE